MSEKLTGHYDTNVVCRALEERQHLDRNDPTVRRIIRMGTKAGFLMYFVKMTTYERKEHGSLGVRFGDKIVIMGSIPEKYSVVAVFSGNTDQDDLDAISRAEEAGIYMWEDDEKLFDIMNQTIHGIPIERFEIRRSTGKRVAFVEPDESYIKFLSDFNLPS